jgi:hypothetical protein
MTPNLAMAATAVVVAAWPGGERTTGGSETYAQVHADGSTAATSAHARARNVTYRCELSPRLLARAFSDIERLGDHPLLQPARAVLATLAQEVGSVPNNRALPELFVRAVDADGSIAIEMRADGWRLLISIEVDASESGWSLVSLPRLGNIAAFGDLSELRRALETANSLSAKTPAPHPLSTEALPSIPTSDPSPTASIGA